MMLTTTLGMFQHQEPSKHLSSGESLKFDGTGDGATVYLVLFSLRRHRLVFLICMEWGEGVMEVWSSIMAMLPRGVSSGFYGPLGFCVWLVCCLLRSELFLSFPFPTGRRPPSAHTHKHTGGKMCMFLLPGRLDYDLIPGKGSEGEKKNQLTS